MTVTELALRIEPWISLKQANAFVFENHRHLDDVEGQLWSIALMYGWELVGVLITSRPVSRVLQRQGCIEITRCCVLEGERYRNGASMLYARARRIAQAFGYSRVVTYNLPTESGASLRGAGFKIVARTKGGSWDQKKRRRTDDHPTCPKNRWEPA
jgi:hypothetical protein